MPAPDLVELLQGGVDAHLDVRQPADGLDGERVHDGFRVGALGRVFAREGQGALGAGEYLCECHGIPYSRNIVTLMKSMLKVGRITRSTSARPRISSSRVAWTSSS